MFSPRFNISFEEPSLGIHQQCLVSQRCHFNITGVPRQHSRQLRNLVGAWELGKWSFIVDDYLFKMVDLSIVSPRKIVIFHGFPTKIDDVP